MSKFHILGERVQVSIGYSALNKNHDDSRNGLQESNGGRNQIDSVIILMLLSILQMCIRYTGDVNSVACIAAKV